MLRKAILVAFGVTISLPMLVRVNRHSVDNPLWPSVIMPLVRRFVDPETAYVRLVNLTKVPRHRWAITACKYDYMPSYFREKDDPILRTRLWSRDFANPIGLAAGFDKDAEVFNSLGNLGFGFVEVGTIVPEPQPGNPKPRVFRLTNDKAIINRYGFNSKGLDYAAKNLSKRSLFYDSIRSDAIIGANFGKNKSTEDPYQDYVTSMKVLGNLADYVVINVSSPNTPNLRQLQQKEHLEQLIEKVQQVRTNLKPEQKDVPILLKVAPDLSPSEIQDIAQISQKMKIDGIVLTNTTISRPESLTSPEKSEQGGLSGKPIFDVSTKALRQMYIETQGKIPLIGVGGVFTGEDALEKIENGASLVQLYSAFALNGPRVAMDIKKDLSKLLKDKGYKTVSDAVGAKTGIKRDISLDIIPSVPSISPSPAPSTATDQPKKVDSISEKRRIAKEKLLKETLAYDDPNINKILNNINNPKQNNTNNQNNSKNQ